jgi:hypothetical protein
MLRNRVLFVKLLMDIAEDRATPQPMRGLMTQA